VRVALEGDEPRRDAGQPLQQVARAFLVAQAGTIRVDVMEHIGEVAGENPFEAVQLDEVTAMGRDDGRPEFGSVLDDRCVFPRIGDAQLGAQQFRGGRLANLFGRVLLPSIPLCALAYRRLCTAVAMRQFAVRKRPRSVVACDRRLVDRPALFSRYPSVVPKRRNLAQPGETEWNTNALEGKRLGAEQKPRETRRNGKTVSFPS
jgi:hypothetical protein